MGNDYTSKQRQANRRERLRQAGLKYMHIWVHPDQEQTIKDFLGGKPLVREDIGQREEELLRRSAAVEEEHQKWQRLIDEVNVRLKGIHEREQAIEAETRRIKSQGAKTEKTRERERISDKDRADALIERFTTDTRLSTAKRQSVDDPYWITQRASQAAALTKQTKTVATALEGLIKEFKGMLGEGEVVALESTVGLIRRIGAAAETAKNRVRTLEKKIHEEDRQRTAMASNAVKSLLDAMSLENQILTNCILNTSDFNWHLRDLLKLKDVPYNMARAKEELRDNMVGRLKANLKAGQTLDAAVLAMKELIQDGTPAAKEKHGHEIERVVAELVAIQLRNTL